MTSDAEAVDAPPSGLAPHKFIGLTLLALCAALFAVWAFVLRPATDDDATIDPDQLVQAGPSTTAPDLIRVGSPVPDVILTGLDGPDIATADLNGSITVINFWASSCAPCIKEMPLLERAHQRLGDTVRFVGVDVFESPDAGRQMIATTGVTYPQTIDPTNEILTRFGGIQLPHTVVLRADGTVAAIHDTAITEDQVLTYLIDAAR